MFLENGAYLPDADQPIQNAEPSLSHISVTRAVHIDMIEEMNLSWYTSALRRFTAIRYDQGTNFIWAVDDLQINRGLIKDLNKNRIEWMSNQPHSSHIGCAWERMISSARQIIDEMLAKPPSRKFLIKSLAPSSLRYVPLSTPDPSRLSQQILGIPHINTSKALDAGNWLYLQVWRAKIHMPSRLYLSYW